MVYSMFLAGFNKGLTKNQILQDWDKKSEGQIRSKSKNHPNIRASLDMVNEKIADAIEFKDAVKKIADLDFSLLKKLSEIYPETKLITSSMQFGKEIGK